MIHLVLEFTYLVGRKYEKSWSNKAVGKMDSPMYVRNNVLGEGCEQMCKGPRTVNISSIYSRK